MLAFNFARIRRFSATAVALLWLAWLSPAAARQDVPPFAITHGPYLQLPSDTSMTIVWHTNRPAVSRVEYWSEDATTAAAPAPANVMTAINSAHGLIDNNRTSHIVQLRGLRPGATYRYRVMSREFQGYEKQHIVRFGGTAASETFTFTTLAGGKASYSFLVVSDIHENVKRLDAMLAATDWRSQSFVVFNGDMVNDFMNADQPFTGFLDLSVTRFASAIPFIYVRGNHDVRGRFARSLSDYFPTRDGRTYYSFDQGPVHFIVLDSGEDKVDSHEYYNGLVAFEPFRREQAAWLASDLNSAAARRARYRVILSHIPPRDGKTPPGAPDEGFAIRQVRECWEMLANAGGVDLWLSGHTHRYAHLAPSRAGNRYDLVIGAPDTFTRVDVARDGLAVTVTRDAGAKVDRISIY